MFNTLKVLGASLFVSSVAFAGTSVGAGLLSMKDNQAIEVFAQSSQATQFRESFPLLNGAETFDSVTYSGFCGFVGCSSTALVSQTLASSGPNTSTQGQIAFVEFPALAGSQEPKVTAVKAAPQLDTQVDAQLAPFYGSDDVVAAAQGHRLASEALAHWAAEGLETETPFVAQLSGQCGFVGCEGTFVVVFSAKTFTTGPSIETAAVFVDVGSLGKAKLYAAEIVTQNAQ